MKFSISSGIPVLRESTSSQSPQEKADMNWLPRHDHWCYSDSGRRYLGLVSQPFNFDLLVYTEKTHLRFCTLSEKRAYDVISTRTTKHSFVFNSLILLCTRKSFEHAISSREIIAFALLEIAAGNDLVVEVSETASGKPCLDWLRSPSREFSTLRYEELRHAKV